MNLSEFAQVILFGTRLEDKLISSAQITTPTTRPQRSIQLPSFPGRPKELLRAQGRKASFPDLNRLHEDRVRGEILHFFSNHELLAAELMALAIVKFPDAPMPFLNSLVSTIGQEQDHLKLYLQRMNELGVSMGELPVSDYFWNCMHQMSSPLEFVVQMSLTFEQANLDFALYYKKLVEQVGDFKTAQILERVYQEEIGHVKNGVHWFHRFRPSPEIENDWDAYVRLLPPPLNPIRAKGIQFCAHARRQAGLSETYIRELEVFSGSKGRPPVLWYYNPSCDAEIARGKPGHTATAGAQNLTLDLEHIPLFLSLENDLVWVRQKPRLEWIASLQKSGFKTPEWAEVDRKLKVSKVGGFQPWGWSPESFELFRPLSSRLVKISGGNGEWCRQWIEKNQSYLNTGLGRLFSKEWSVGFLRKWMERHPQEKDFGSLDEVGAVCRSWEDVQVFAKSLFDRGRTAMVKAPYGTAGAQVRHLIRLEELDGKLGGWIRNVIGKQGSVILEERLNRIYDLSIQMQVREEKVELLEVRRFITGNQFEYRGTFLGKKLSGFEEEDLRFLHQALPKWRALVSELGDAVRAAGYLGPAGVDALIWKDSRGGLKLKPLVELNPRWTMGRVGLELEKHLKPGVRAVWAFLPVSEIKNLGFHRLEDFAEDCLKRYPVRCVEVPGGDLRIESGVIFTNDPQTARMVLTVLVVSELGPEMSPLKVLLEKQGFQI